MYAAAISLSLSHSKITTFFEADVFTGSEIRVGFDFIYVVVGSPGSPKVQNGHFIEGRSFFFPPPSLLLLLLLIGEGQCAAASGASE